MKKLTRKTAVIAGTILAAMLLMAGCENTKEPGTEFPTGLLSPTVTLAQPTETPEPTPTPVPSVTEPITETPEPTSPVTPTDVPTEAPSNTPTQTPEAPTEAVTPTVEAATPTKAPTKEPTKEATKAPTKAATPTVTKKATPTPTKKVTVKPTATPTKKPTPTQNDPAPLPLTVRLVPELLEMTNRERDELGLRHIMWGDKELEEIALERVVEIITDVANGNPHAGIGKYYHKGLNCAVGEIICVNASTAESAFETWRDSPSHWASIITDDTEDFYIPEDAGVTFVKDGKTYYPGDTLPGRDCYAVFAVAKLNGRNYWVSVGASISRANAGE